MIDSTVSNGLRSTKFGQELEVFYSRKHIDSLSNDYRLKIFENLTLPEIGRVALVSQKWQRLSEMCPLKWEKKRQLHQELVEGKVLNKKLSSEVTEAEWKLLASMLKGYELTEIIVSKFIYWADDESVLSVIRKSQHIDQRHLEYDLMSKSKVSPAVLKTLLGNRYFTAISNYCVTQAIKSADIEAIKIFKTSEKVQFSTNWLLFQAVEYSKTEVIDFIFKTFPNEITDCPLKPILSMQIFESILNKCIELGIVVETRALKSIYDNGRYLKEPEKVYTLLADAFVKTNNIRTLKSLNEDSDRKDFIHLKKYQPLTEKIIHYAKKANLIEAPLRLLEGHFDIGAELSRLPREIINAIVKGFLFSFLNTERK